MSLIMAGSFPDAKKEHEHNEMQIVHVPSKPSVKQIPETIQCKGRT
jgi:hypothetical protein